MRATGSPWSLPTSQDKNKPGQLLDHILQDVSHSLTAADLPFCSSMCPVAACKKPPLQQRMPWLLLLYQLAWPAANTLAAAAAAASAAALPGGLASSCVAVDGWLLLERTVSSLCCCGLQLNLVGVPAGVAGAETSQTRTQNTKDVRNYAVHHICKKWC